jgi:hypothetical protein
MHVCMYMYVCMYVCMYPCMYVSMYVCTCVCICVYVCMCGFVRMCLYLCNFFIIKHAPLRSVILHAFLHIIQYFAERRAGVVRPLPLLTF